MPAERGYYQLNHNGLKPTEALKHCTCSRCHSITCDGCIEREYEHLTDLGKEEYKKWAADERESKYLKGPRVQVRENTIEKRTSTVYGVRDRRNNVGVRIRP